MSEKKQQPTSWRAKNIQQQKDKNEIYQSREWRELSILKKRANPLCELCLAEGIVTAVKDVHHIHPIEESSTKEEMRKWAFMWSNLLSVCKYHHAKIHREAGANKKENVQERRELRQARWKSALLDRFTNNKEDDNGIQTEVHTGLVREPSTDRANETKAQTDPEGDSGCQGDMG